MKLSNREIPFHIQIRNDLLVKIRRREVQPNSRLPSEEELARQYGVSRATVRQAIGSLEKDGLIYKRQGSGTYLTDKILQFQKERVQGDRKHIFLGDMIPDIKILEIKEITAPVPVTHALHISPGDKVVYLRRVASVRRKPLAYIENFIRHEFGFSLNNEDLERNSLLSILTTRYLLKIDRIKHTISVKRADEQISRALRILTMDPVLAFDTVVFLAHDTPLELVQSYFREDRYQYIVEA